MLPNGGCAANFALSVSQQQACSQRLAPLSAVGESSCSHEKKRKKEELNLDR
jgi:hypothetical protein